MTACLCPQCSALVGPTYSEAHRVLTEARYVLSLPFDSRRTYIDSLPRARRDHLARAVKAEWDKRKEAA